MDKLEQEIDDQANLRDDSAIQGKSSDELVDILKVKNNSLTKRNAILERDLERKTDEQVAAIEENEHQFSKIMDLEKAVKNALKETSRAESDLEKEKAAAIKASDDLNIRLQEIDSRNKHLEGDLAETTRVREEAEARIKKLDGERDRIQRELDALRKSHDADVKKLEAVQEKLSELEAVRQKLDRELEESREAAARLRDEVKGVKEAERNAREEAKANAEKVTSLSAEFDQTKAKLEEAGKRADGLGHKTKELQSQLDQREHDFTRELNDLNQQMESITRERVELDGKFKRVSGDFDRIKSEKAALADEAGELRDKVQIVSRDLEHRTSEQVAASGKARRLEAENTELVERNKELTEQSHELGNRMKEINHQLVDAQSKVQGLSRGKEEAEAKVGELTEKADTASGLVKEISGKLSQTSKELSVVQGELKQAVDGRAESEVRAAKLESRSKSLEAQVVELEDEVAKGFVQVKGFADKMLELRKDNQALRAEANDSGGGSDEAARLFAEKESGYKAEINTLKGKIESLNKQIEEMPEAAPVVTGDTSKAQEKVIDLSAKLAAAEDKQRQQENLVVALKDEVGKLTKLNETSSGSSAGGKGAGDEEVKALKEELNKLQAEHRALINDVRNSPPSDGANSEEMKRALAERDELLRSKKELETLLMAYKEGSEEEDVNAELEALLEQKAQMNSELAQARMTIMDAANIMNKTKALEEELSQAKKENDALKKCVVAPSSADSLRDDVERMAGSESQKTASNSVERAPVATDTDAGFKLKPSATTPPPASKLGPQSVLTPASVTKMTPPAAQEPAAPGAGEAKTPPTLNKLTAVPQEEEDPEDDAVDSRLKLRPMRDAEGDDEAGEGDGETPLSRTAFSKSLFGSVKAPKKKKK